MRLALGQIQFRLDWFCGEVVQGLLKAFDRTIEGSAEI
jgi:hypothetical protein